MPSWARERRRAAASRSSASRQARRSLKRLLKFEIFLQRSHWLTFRRGFQISKAFEVITTLSVCSFRRAAAVAVVHPKIAGKVLSVHAAPAPLDSVESSGVHRSSGRHEVTWS